MTDHVFRNIYRYVLSAVMNRNRVTDEARQDSRSTGPSLDDFLFGGIVQASIFFTRDAAANGPFLIDLDTVLSPSYYFRLFTISLVDDFFQSRVLTP